MWDLESTSPLCLVLKLRQISPWEQQELPAGRTVRKGRASSLCSLSEIGIEKEEWIFDGRLYIVSLLYSHILSKSFDPDPGLYLFRSRNKYVLIRTF